MCTPVGITIILYYIIKYAEAPMGGCNKYIIAEGIMKIIFGDNLSQHPSNLRLFGRLADMIIC